MQGRIVDYSPQTMPSVENELLANPTLLARSKMQMPSHMLVAGEFESKTIPMETKTNVGDCEPITIALVEATRYQKSKGGPWTIAALFEVKTGWEE